MTEPINNITTMIIKLLHYSCEKIASYIKRIAVSLGFVIISIIKHIILPNILAYLPDDIVSSLT